MVAVNFSAIQFRPETIAAWLAFYVEAQKSAAMRRLLKVYARRLHSNLMSGLIGILPRGEADRAAEAIGGADRRALHQPRAEGRRARRRDRDRAGRRLSRNETRRAAKTVTTTRPNILIVMVDQLNGTLFPDGPADFLHAPHLKALAARSARFANNYTASPLCAPGRASFMSGQLPSRTGSTTTPPNSPRRSRPLRIICAPPAITPCLSGKMHFVGPDQLHGFEERLTTDIYPADFGWTPDYRKPGERIDWWYHNLGSVTGAGVAEITNQMEYDDEVAFLAAQKLYRLRPRSDDPRTGPGA